MERVRSMFLVAILEKKLYAEVIATACYLINRSPSSALADKMPMEV
jgi:hypothetical protein